MLCDDRVNLERDARFPSGVWTGFFLQLWLPGRHKTDMRLTYREGELTGTGLDWVGPYSVQGSYEVSSGRCEWVKRYHGKHSVTYRGCNDGHGIWGVWEIRQLAGLFTDRGGFHIWPEGSDVSEESDRTEQAVVALMRKEYGNAPSRAFFRLLLLVMTAMALVYLVLEWYRSY